MDVNIEKPIFHYSSLVFNVATFSLVVCIFYSYQNREDTQGSYIGIQPIAFALLGLAAGFVCAVIGYNRNERLNLLTKINSGLSLLIVVLVLLLCMRSQLGM